MCSIGIILMCFFSLFIARSCCAVNMTEGAIGFPEKEENANLKNSENREPVFLPSMCEENELYYPGDQKDDWICDCRPSHIYQPASEKCWPAYRKGPCQEGQYLILPPNTYIPICAVNPCKVDTFVPWKESCARLGSTTPCAQSYPNALALGVNATTLLVSCVKLNIESRFIEQPAPTASCLPGCKRSINRKCTNA